jgi:hypothetical protein
MSRTEGAAIVDFAQAANRLRLASPKALQYPRLKTQNATLRNSSGRVAEQQTEADYIDEILRFRCALVNLAANNSDPADIIRYMDPLFGDVPLIRAHLAHAVRWINRFAEEWGHEQKSHGSPGEVHQGSE